MISVYLNDTSITNINALYHHFRLEMMAEQEREDHIRDNMDWGFSKEHSIALVDNCYSTRTLMTKDKNTREKKDFFYTITTIHTQRHVIGDLTPTQTYIQLCM